MSHSLSVKSTELVFTALTNLPLVSAGDDLVALILGECAEVGKTLSDGDVLILAQKIVIADYSVIPTTQSVTTIIIQSSIMIKLNIIFQ